MTITDEHFEAIKSASRLRMHHEVTVSMIGIALADMRAGRTQTAFDILEDTYNVERKVIDDLFAADQARNATPDQQVAA